jgi:hypothetical protein
MFKAGDGGEEMTQEDWVYLSKKMFGDNELTEVRADYLRFQHPWITLGEVWNWATKQEWWPKFVAQNGDYQLDEPAAGLKECGWVDTYIIDPTRFPKLITDFLREREKGEGDGTET